MDEKKAKRFASFLVKKYGEDGAKKKIQKIQKTGKVDEEDLKEFLASELKLLQAQAKKALHGAKLNYFKSLKNQCAEDEEIVYYKKGGSVGCGCKKKEDGGQVNKASIGGVVERFKNRTKQKIEEVKKLADKKEADKAFKEHRMIPGKHLPKGNNNVTEAERKDVTKDLKGSKIKKNCGGAAVKAFKTAKCGGKVKKHQEGGWILSGYANPYIDITERVINPNNKYQWVRRTIQSNPELPNDTVYKTGNKSGFPKDQNSLKGLFNKYYIEDPEWNKKQNMSLFLQKAIKTKLKGDKLMNGYIPKVK